MGTRNGRRPNPTPTTVNEVYWTGTMNHLEDQVDSIVWKNILFFILLIPLPIALFLPLSVIYNGDRDADNHCLTFM